MARSWSLWRRSSSNQNNCPWRNDNTELVFGNQTYSVYTHKLHLYTFTSHKGIRHEMSESKISIVIGNEHLLHICKQKSQLINRLPHLNWQKLTNKLLTLLWYNHFVLRSGALYLSQFQIPHSVLPHLCQEVYPITTALISHLYPKWQFSKVTQRFHSLGRSWWHK